SNYLNINRLHFRPIYQSVTENRPFCPLFGPKQCRFRPKNSPFRQFLQPLLSISLALKPSCRTLKALHRIRPQTSNAIATHFEHGSCRRNTKSYKGLLRDVTVVEDEASEQTILEIQVNGNRGVGCRRCQNYEATSEEKAISKEGLGRVEVIRLTEEALNIAACFMMELWPISRGRGEMADAADLSEHECPSGNRRRRTAQSRGNLKWQSRAKPGSTSGKV
ncbi:MAG: hypothetical protein ABR907_11750, partial [Terracidiphilus sp.]